MRLEGRRYLGGDSEGFVTEPVHRGVRWDAIIAALCTVVFVAGAMVGYVLGMMGGCGQ